MARTERFDVSRDAWLGYRWRRHGLSGDSKEQLEDLLLLGFPSDRQSGRE